MTKPIIILVGAFERDNLGDILFSKILKKILSDYTIINCSLISNDLSSIGGDRVLSMSSIKSLNLNPVAVIHCGGETLTCSKENALMMDLDSSFYKKMLPNYNFAIDEINNTIIPEVKTLGYVFDHSDIKINKKVPIGYISVGGSNTDIFKKNPSIVNQLKTKLKSLKCLIVREESTSKNLRKYLNIKSCIYPDIVNIISDVCKREVDSIVNTSSFFKKNKPDSYVVFQANEEYILKNKINLISKQLVNIARKSSKSIVIQPMGLANLHDSILLYEKLLLNIKNRSMIKIILQPDRNIWKQIAVLANSGCNIGTSLHLRIISNSFARHCISLENEKVTNYIKTWKQDNQPYDIKLRDLERSYKESFLINNSELNKVRNYFKNKTIEGLNQLCKKLNIKPKFNSQLTNFEVVDMYSAQLSKELNRNNELLINSTIKLNNYKELNKNLKIALNQTFSQIKVEKKLLEENQNLKNQIGQIKIDSQNLENTLNKIKSAKFFKLWQSYCKIRDKIFKKNYESKIT